MSDVHGRVRMRRQTRIKLLARRRRCHKRPVMLGTTPRCTNSPPDSARRLRCSCASLRSNAPPTSAGRGGRAPPVELVQSLFDLTPAEARVARSLAAGKSVDDIAADGGTSANTIRTQVRGVLEKTGCKRQVDIVALLTAISATRLTSPH